VISDHYLVYREQFHNSPRIQAFCTFMQQKIDFLKQPN
jgi:hypothetical protein